MNGSDAQIILRLQAQVAELAERVTALEEVRMAPLPGPAPAVTLPAPEPEEARPAVRQTPFLDTSLTSMPKLRRPVWRDGKRVLMRRNDGATR